MIARNFRASVLAAVVIASAQAAQPPVQRKVMITEVCPYGTETVELTNYGTGPASLASHVIRWRFNDVTQVSSALGFTMSKGEIVVIRDGNGSVNLGIPTWIRRFTRLPPMAVPFGASVSVALVDGAGVVIDEVRILGLAQGATSQGSLGGSFRGLAQPGAALSGAPSVERIWGLDSDSAGDWCRSVAQTMGRENSCSGPRTVDPVAVENVVINEVWVNSSTIILTNRSIELHNRSANIVDLHDWYFLVSGGQGLEPAVAAPWTGPALVPGGAYVVLQDSILAFPPAEMPAGTFYYAGPGVGFPLGPGEFSIALYDDLGRLVDLVRTTALGTEVVHNHPRAPAAWDDFIGAARRLSGTSGLARYSTTADTDMGADWRPTTVRSMGLPNISFAAGPGDGASPDVRLHEGGEGDGLTLIVNAGPALAGARFFLLTSFVRSDGTGPILGLAPDCLERFVTLSLANVEPFGAVLDAAGVYRYEIPWHTFPAGIETDNIGVVQSPSLFFGAIMTRVLEFDT